MGEDGIPNEVWKYGGEDLVINLWSICQRIWMGEDWPQDLREGVVVPILKKGAGNKAED